MATFENILLPTDFSASAEKATETALSLAQALGAALTVLHVIPTPPFYGYQPGRDWPLPAEELPREARRMLDAAVRRLELRCSRLRGELGSGEPSEQILSLAHESGVDLIVMGTHGRRGLSHLLMGSVAEQVVRRSIVPVLVVSARD